MVDETNVLSQTGEFVSDTAGYLTWQVDRLGRAQQFVYDDLGRETDEVCYNNL